MKNIITILLVILISSKIFCQIGYSLSVFEDKPEFVKASNSILQFKQKNWDFNDYVEQVYAFYINDELYVLSYENDCSNCQQEYGRFLKYNEYHGDSIGRNLRLFHLNVRNNIWEFASDIIKTDYRKSDTKGVITYSFYYPYRKDLSDLVHINDNVSKGSISILDNGNIEMTIMYFEREYGKDRDKLKWMKVLLKPKGNNYYNLIK